MDLIKVLSKAVSAPVLQGILEMISLLKLTPLAIWGPNVGIFSTRPTLVHRSIRA
jgi:hypothetical protein